MPDPQHPTRLALLDAGLVLAGEVPLTQLSVDRVVQQAGVAKGTFYIHFPDRTTFLVALHRRFHELMEESLRQVTDGVEPGAARLGTAMVRYLDDALSRRGARALLAGAGDPSVRDHVEHIDDCFATLAAADLRAAGVGHPRETARLLVAATAEAAQTELSRRRRQPALRAALLALIPARGAPA